MRTRPTSTGPDVPAPADVAQEGSRPMHALFITFRSAVAPEELKEDFTQYAEALRDGGARGLIVKTWLVDGLDHRRLLPLRGSRGSPTATSTGCSPTRSRPPPPSPTSASNGTTSTRP